ncbi:hypothetical protein AYL99_04072 [Fonsecaea erecta]|uniref:DUF7908 domain-containing protein n=1 Tax=Fonsecaea erecta TaxID=1367422 RepID=A0A178ZPW5_9EURO|nr:hypothetical protein AYL99_04072 [Fonsecaea erecta]OAP61869.1 hypothetical protein AYL99_04072 [Fonsecaea erecta]
MLPPQRPSLDLSLLALAIRPPPLAGLEWFRASLIRGSHPEVKLGIGVSLNYLATGFDISHDFAAYDFTFCVWVIPNYCSWDFDLCSSARKFNQQFPIGINLTIEPRYTSVYFHTHACTTTSSPVAISTTTPGTTAALSTVTTSTTSALTPVTTSTTTPSTVDIPTTTQGTSSTLTPEITSTTTPSTVDIPTTTQGTSSTLTPEITSTASTTTSSPECSFETITTTLKKRDVLEVRTVTVPAAGCSVTSSTTSDPDSFSSTTPSTVGISTTTPGSSSSGSTTSASGPSVETSTTVPPDPATSTSVTTSTPAGGDGLPSTTSLTTVAVTVTTSGTSSTTLTADTSAPTAGQPFSLIVNNGGTGKHKRDILVVGYVNGALVLVSSPDDAVAFILTSDGVLMIFGTSLVVGFGGGSGTSALTIYSSVSAMPTTIVWSVSGGALILPGAGFCVGANNVMSVTVGSATDSSCTPVTPVPDTDPDSYNTEVASTVTPSPQTTTSNTPGLSSTTVDATTTTDSLPLATTTGVTSPTSSPESPTSSPVNPTSSPDSPTSTPDSPTSSPVNPTSTPDIPTSSFTSAVYVSTSSPTSSPSSPVSSSTTAVYVSTSSSVVLDSTTSDSSPSTTTTTTTSKSEETSGPNCSILPLSDQTAPDGTQYTQFFYSCNAAIPTTLGDSYSSATSGVEDFSTDPTAFLSQCVATAEQLGASVWTYYQSSSDFNWHCGFWNGLVADDDIFVDDPTVFTMNAMTVLGADGSPSSTTTSSSSTTTSTIFFTASSTTSASPTTSTSLTSSTSSSLSPTTDSSTSSSLSTTADEPTSSSLFVPSDASTSSSLSSTSSLATTSSTATPTSFASPTTSSVTSTTSSANCVATSASVGDVLNTPNGNSWIDFFSSGCGLSLDWQTLNFNNLYVYQRSDYTFDEALLDCAEVADNDGSAVFEFETDTRNNDRWVCWTLNDITNDPSQFQPYPGIADAYGWYLPSRLVSVTTTTSASASTTTSAPISTLSTLILTSASTATTTDSAVAPPTTSSILTTTSDSAGTTTTFGLPLPTTASTLTTTSASTATTTASSTLTSSSSTTSATTTGAPSIDSTTSTPSVDSTTSTSSLDSTTSTPSIDSTTSTPLFDSTTSTPSVDSTTSIATTSTPESFVATSTTSFESTTSTSSLDSTTSTSSFDSSTTSTSSLDSTTSTSSLDSTTSTLSIDSTTSIVRTSTSAPVTTSTSSFDGSTSTPLFDSSTTSTFSIDSTTSTPPIDSTTSIVTTSTLVPVTTSTSSFDGSTSTPSVDSTTSIVTTSTSVSATTSILSFDSTTSTSSLDSRTTSTSSLDSTTSTLSFDSTTSTSSFESRTTSITTTSTSALVTTTSITTLDDTTTSTSVTSTGTTTTDGTTTSTSVLISTTGITTTTVPITSTSASVTTTETTTSTSTFYLAAETVVTTRKVKRDTEYLALNPQTGLSSLVDSEAEASTFTIADDDSLMVVVDGTPVWVGLTIVTPTQLVMETVAPNPPVTASIDSNGVLTISSVAAECILNGGLVVSKDGSIPDGCVPVTLVAVSGNVAIPVGSSTTGTTTSSSPVLTTSSATATTTSSTTTSSATTTSATSTTTTPACTPSPIGDVTAYYNTTQIFRDVFTGCGESLEGATAGGLEYLPKQFAVSWQASENWEGWTFDNAVSRCVQYAVDEGSTAVEFYIDVDQNWFCVGVNNVAFNESSFYPDSTVVNVWGFVWENSCQNTPLDDIVASDGTVFSEFYTGCSASFQGNTPGGLQYLNRVVSVDWLAPDYSGYTFDAAVQSCADDTTSQGGTMFEFYVGSDDSWNCIAVNDLPAKSDSFYPDATVGQVWGFAITESTAVCEPSQLAGSIQLANGTTYDEFYDGCHVSLEGDANGGPGTMINVFGFNNPPGDDGNHGGWTLETSLQQCITDSAAAGATLVEFYENSDEEPTWYCFGVVDVPAQEDSFYGDGTVNRLWAFKLDESTLPTTN